MNLLFPLSDQSPLQRSSIRLSFNHVIKGTAEIAAFATLSFGSYYLASTHPGAWWISVIGMNTVNLSSLPQILRYGNLTLAKAVLIVNLLAISCLGIRGLGFSIFALSWHLALSLKAFQLAGILNCTFLITGMISFGVPLFYKILVNAHRLFSTNDADRGIISLQQQFLHSNGGNAPPNQSHSFESILLQIALFCPELILYLHANEIHVPDYAFSMAVAASARININQFDQMLASIELLADNLAAANVRITPGIQTKKINLIKGAFKLLDPSDLPVAMTAFLTRGSNLIPQVISDQQFLEFFNEDIILDASNKMIKTFLDETKNWKALVDRYQQLISKLINFERDISGFSSSQDISDKMKDFEQLYGNYNTDYNDLRKDVEKIYHQTRPWQNIAPICSNASHLPFDQGIDLIQILNDKVLFAEIYDLHRSILETSKSTQRSMHDLMQSITNKRETLQDEEMEDETVTAVMYLAASRGFIQKDFEDMRTWLDADSLNDLESVMASIGLGTEDDLYKKNILSLEVSLSKTEISQRLQTYIENLAKSDLKKRMRPISLTTPKSNVLSLSNKVAAVIYQAITSALILTPVFINPYGALLGFSLGLGFFTLKRFQIPGVQTAYDIGYHFYNSGFLNRFIRKYVLSGVFTRDSHNRQDSTNFENGNFSYRLREINLKIAISRIFLNQPFISFARGAVMSQEIVGFF